MKLKQSIRSFCLLVLMPGFSPQAAFSAPKFENEAQFFKEPVLNRQESINEAGDQIFEIPLVELGLPENSALTGPFQEVGISFNLPPDWALTTPVTLELHTTIEFFTFLEAFTEGTTGTKNSGFSGNLEITLNDQKVESQAISENGDFTYTIEIPVSAFLGSRTVQTLKIGWDSVLACQYSIASILTIKPESFLRFTYNSTAFTPEISRFPEPFFIDKNISPVSTAILIPQDPSNQELSALLSVSAGLGKLSGGELLYELFSTDQLNPEVFSTDHLILVGKFDSLESTLLKMSMGNEIKDVLETIDENNGLVFMSVSPWNQSRAVMVVTGRNDIAVLEAGTALGVKGILPFSGNQYAVIKDMDTEPSSSQYQIDQALNELGSQDVISIEKLGETLHSFQFVIPPDISINPEAYVELYFRHSQLLDYLRSNIAVSINDVIIGNIRMGDQTNENGVVRFILPPNVIKPSLNILSIRSSLASQDICGDSRSGDYWASIFGDSYLHLPPTIEPQGIKQTYYLSDFPFPFINLQSLKNTTFVLEKGDFHSLNKAFEIVYGFGNLTQSKTFMPSVIYSGEFSPEISEGNYLAIGLSGSIPFTSGINKILPLPFDTNGNLDKYELPGVSFDLNQNQDLGFLQFTQLPDNNVNIISIMGNTFAGLDNAVNALTSDSNAVQLDSMNIAVVTEDGQISGSYYQAIPPDSIEDEAKSDLNRQFFSPVHYPYYLLIIVVISISVLLLWPIFSRKKPE